ncbi:hypothetical protein O181_068465, partial [Austropuccinia psidii MF-1]|nr:hypothetical protein [Austropuccinia psidii MF-1]
MPHRLSAKKQTIKDLELLWALAESEDTDSIRQKIAGFPTLPTFGSSMAPNDDLEATFLDLMSSDGDDLRDLISAVTRAREEDFEKPVQVTEEGYSVAVTDAITQLLAAETSYLAAQFDLEREKAKKEDQYRSMEHEIEKESNIRVNRLAYVNQWLQEGHSVEDIEVLLHAKFK